MPVGTVNSNQKVADIASERRSSQERIFAKRALEKGIETVVFDRGGYIYHGRVQELADGAREGGLKF